jgi:hypothetical protein
MVYIQTIYEFIFMLLKMQRGIQKSVCKNIKSKVKNLREENEDKHFLIDRLLTQSNPCPEDRFYLQKIGELLIEFEIKENHFLQLFKKDNEDIDKFINKCQTEINKRNELNERQERKIKNLEDEKEDLVYSISDLRKIHKQSQNKIQMLEEENEDLVYRISDLKKKMK